MSGDTGSGTRFEVLDEETITFCEKFLTDLDLCMQQRFPENEDPPLEPIGDVRVDIVVGVTASRRTKQLFFLWRKLKQTRDKLAVNRNNPTARLLNEDFIQSVYKAMVASLITEFPILCNPACLDHIVICKRWMVVVRNEGWIRAVLRTSWFPDKPFESPGVYTSGDFLNIIFLIKIFFKKSKKYF